MKQEIEIEFKNLLTKQEYDHMLTTYPFPANAQKQINYYFETDDFALKQHRSALRIREKDGTFTMTLKEPYIEGLLETHVSLTEEEALSCINGELILKRKMRERLLSLEISQKQLQYYGSLQTKRRECVWHNMLLVLDFSQFNGVVDYEFELEASDYDTGENIFLEILHESHIEIKKTPNKIERFFTTLEE